MKRFALLFCGLFVASAVAATLAHSLPSVDRIWSYEVHGTTAGLSVVYKNHMKPTVVVFQLSESSDMAGLKVASQSNEHGASIPTTAHAFLTGLHPGRAYWYRALITTADGKATSAIGNFRTTAAVAVKPTVKLEKFTEYDANRFIVSYIAYAPGEAITFTARWSLRPDMSAPTVYYTDTVPPQVGAVGFHPMFKISSVPPNPKSTSPRRSRPRTALRRPFRAATS